MANINKYQVGKAKAREEAQKWQHDISQNALAWWDIAHMGDYFEELGRRFGLIREFRENGII